MSQIYGLRLMLQNRSICFYNIRSKYIQEAFWDESRRFFILINTDYKESTTTAAGGDTRANRPQSAARGNKRSISYRLNKYAPDKRQLKLDFGTSKEENTGGGT